MLELNSNDLQRLSAIINEMPHKFAAPLLQVLDGAVKRRAAPETPPTPPEPEAEAAQ